MLTNSSDGTTIEVQAALSHSSCGRTLKQKHSREKVDSTPRSTLDSTTYYLGLQKSCILVFVGGVRYMASAIASL